MAVEGQFTFAPRRSTLHDVEGGGLDDSLTNKSSDSELIAAVRNRDLEWNSKVEICFGPDAYRSMERMKEGRTTPIGQLMSSSARTDCGGVEYVVLFNSLLHSVNKINECSLVVRDIDKHSATVTAHSKLFVRTSIKRVTFAS